MYRREFGIFHLEAFRSSKLEKIPQHETPFFIDVNGGKERESKFLCASKRTLAFLRPVRPSAPSSSVPPNRLEVTKS
uniref:Uncharacterized protein n=1 Tax=Caenorhabditis tropicalis TaxID=1561998 RepID=A0A1I7T8C3_9PELO